MAASRCKSQEAVRTHGSSKCSTHCGKEVIYLCKTCDILVCIDCATNQHKGHGKESLDIVIPRSKQKLQDFITRAEQVHLPRFKEKLQKVSEDMSLNKNKFQNQVIQIRQRNETIKMELDTVTDTLVKTCHDIEHKNSVTLLNHQKEIQTQIDELTSMIQEVKASIQSGNDVLVFDTSHVIPSEFDDLPTPCCSTAEFMPCKSQLQQLEHLLGELNISDHDHYQPSPSSSHHEKWKVVSEFTPHKGHAVKSMQTVGDKTWLCFYTLGSGNYVNQMLSINQHGEVHKSLYMDVRVTDFCVSPQTGNIWYCSDQDKSVREVRGNREPVKFRQSTIPWCICVTRDNHVLVGIYSEIVKYTQTGEEVYRTSPERPVMRRPHHISECPVTRHIAIVDWEWRHGDDNSFVSILNNTLQLLHTYRGDPSSQLPPPNPFHPNDVCFTNTGELVIIDSNNKSVVLVTGTGRYLQTLYTHSELQPIALCVHSGALWVSMNDGNVQVLKDPSQSGSSITLPVSRIRQFFKNLTSQPRN